MFAWRSAREASISVSESGYLPMSEQPIRVGDDRLRLELRPSASVSGRIQCAKGLRPRVELRTSDGKLRTGGGSYNPKNGSFRFTFDDVPPGAATFRFGRAGGELAEIRIHIAIGHSGYHPDLKDLQTR